MKVARLHNRRLRAQIRQHADSARDGAYWLAVWFKDLTNATTGAHAKVVKYTPELIAYRERLRQFVLNPWQAPHPGTLPRIEYEDSSALFKQERLPKTNILIHFTPT